MVGVGRKPHPYWKQLEFTPVTKDADTPSSRNRAQCNICLRVMSNTSVQRFQQHRKCCKIPNLPYGIETKTYWNDEDAQNQNNSMENMVEEDDTMNSDQDYLFVKEEPQFESEEANPIAYIDVQQGESKIDIEVLDEYKHVVPTTSNSLPSPKLVKRPRFTPTPTHTMITPKKQFQMKDSLAIGEQEQLDAALAKFIFGCNIPFSVVESDHFIEFIKKLRPAYAEKMPGRKTLSNNLLNRTYEDCVKNNSPHVERDSVLLIDRWENESQNSKTIISSLGSINKPSVFMNTMELLEDSKREEDYMDVIKATIQNAKEMYNTDVYAVISPENIESAQLDETTSTLWHMTCNSSAINSLAMDIMNSSRVTNCVPFLDGVLKEFKRLNLDGLLVRNGGLKVVLPRKSSWTSFQDSFLCFNNNLSPIRNILDDPENSLVAEQMKPNIKALLYKEEFVENCRQIFKVLVEIYRFFKAMETASIATALKLWLDFEQNEAIKEFAPLVAMWKNSSICDYHYVAHYLHPFYDSSVLCPSELDSVNDFLIDKLDGTGIEDWNAFRTNSGIFKTLTDKKLSDPIAYWNTAQLKHPTLASLAIKLLHIPATSSKINRSSDSYYVYRNNLPFEKASKLLHVYYTLRIEDANKSGDY